MKYILEMDISPEHCQKVNGYPSFVVSEAMMELAKKIHNGSNAPGLNVERPGQRDVFDYHGNKVGTWKVLESVDKVENDSLV